MNSKKINNMKNTDILSRINALLSKKVELEQMTLENGTVVEADSFAVGEPIFAIDGENKTPLEIGEYIMADGTKLYVTEIGVIGELATTETEIVEEELSIEPEVETEAEPVVEELAEVPPTIEEVIAKVMEAMQPKIDELQAKLDEVITAHSNMKETLSSVSAKKPLTHKPNETKLSKVSKTNAYMSAEELIYAKLASFNN
jgi:hypothetical protein